jgi:protein O-GlcNAc transferase
MTLEANLLVVCAKVATTDVDNTAIRGMLREEIDWTLFAKSAADRGLVGLAGHTLLHVAPDMLPGDISDAFSSILERTRAENRKLFEKLDSTLEVNPDKGWNLSIQNACAAANEALALNPNDAEALRGLANALAMFGRRTEALACFDRAIALAPDSPRIWSDCAAVAAAIGQLKQALKCIDQSLALDPRYAYAWAVRADTLSLLRRFDEAVVASDKALALDPENVLAARVGIHSRLLLCDWEKRDEHERRIAAAVKAGKAIINPFNHQAMFDSESANLMVAEIWAKRLPRSQEALWNGERYLHDKIRVAYMSTDFFDTMAVNAIAGCFEGHDKARFEITAISMGPGDGSETRLRIERAFDRFIDVQNLDDAQVAKLLRESEIDIAIDVNGYSGNKRTGILARRPAPVQVNYLGFPGTMGVPFIDYIIADRVVIPEENRIHYSEKVVYLPDTYFPTDRKRRIAESTPSRVDLGLPERGFIFACHNTAYKISPEMFDVWMKLLRAVEGSVLWLSSRVPSAIDRLQREAAARNVSPERIIFAPRMPDRADHLARFRAADLFLDTLPYNAHTTACDALWAGLPVLTCPGNSFPARVAASMLFAAGLPELVTKSIRDYEELARTLAHDPKLLSTVKAKLMRNRDTEALFDTARFTRNLEIAYITMWEQQQAGLAPKSFAVGG